MAIEKLLTPELQDFIENHKNDDPHKLSLKFSAKKESFDIKEAINQIQARQKAKNKLPEWWSRKGLLFPPLISMEQCSSELTAKFKAGLIKGNSIVDLTGGFGVDCYYLSRNFTKATYIEQYKPLFEIVDHNYKTLEAHHISTLNVNAEEFSHANTVKFDWVYIDPARRSDVNQKLYKLQDCEPDIVNLKSEIFKFSPNILVKTSPMLDIKQAVKELESVYQIWVISVNNECKEVLYALRNVSNEDEAITITTINLGKNHTDAFETIWDQTVKPKINYHEPKIGDFLYEANASIMKAGIFDHLSEKLSIDKIAPNSHLFTNSHLLQDFPGRKFKIEHVLPFDKKKILRCLPDKKANISQRNFHLSPEQIKKKTGIKDGGDIYIFFSTDNKNKPIVFVTKKAD
ncbi:THUMP-like domain-containing protein [Aureibacter tunicatorum]|uniref:16S rRNA G966 N2-methylase RsmD n=1 Tax=Aureibacter tunicatorum TaxID=866807 RepID=A0AAE3XL92_9BACT|nr:RsmD family RNA methyltransferase [Aureibacter tunicatorum]MDR6237841.1 16S rRNA G966 N2-methylase RsmD [Aureibacter tunicatorum]BDD02876.1 hypothetical protein AUTU_03590 [Aureibacter tunicatorum]